MQHINLGHKKFSTDDQKIGWYINYLCTHVLYRPMCKVFDAGKCITRGGPWTLIRDFFGPNTTSEASGILPKKSQESRSRAHPKQCTCPHQTLYTRGGIRHRCIGNFIHMSPSKLIFRTRRFQGPLRAGPRPARPPVCTLCMGPQGGEGGVSHWQPARPGNGYKKVTMAQLVKRSPLGVKVLGSILALMRFLPESKTSPSSILTNLGC